MRRVILIASLPLLVGAHDCKGGRTAFALATPRSCGAICEELAGAWGVTVAPPTSVMVACSDHRVDGTAAPFPPDAIGLGEVEVAPSASGPLIAFRSAGPSVRIAGTLDPAAGSIRFDLLDGQGMRIRCSGLLRKLADPAGVEGWVARTACESGMAGSAECRLEPPSKVTLLIQRILKEGEPSR